MAYDTINRYVSPHHNSWADQTQWEVLIITLLTLGCDIYWVIIPLMQNMPTSKKPSFDTYSNEPLAV